MILTVAPAAPSGQCPPGDTPTSRRLVKPEPGKTKISIRLDKAVLDHFRDQVDKAGGGNYQTLINDALLEHIHQRSALDVVRRVVREELASYSLGRRSALRSRGRASKAPRGR